MKAVNMYIAIDENNKTIVISDIKKDIELKYKKYYCPNCKSEVIPKIGKIRSAHFAHKNHCCDFRLLTNKYKNYLFVFYFEKI